MKNVIIIPARLQSSRLKEKLLKKIKGKTILEYTYENASRCNNCDKVIIATDSQRIAESISHLTSNIIFTSNNHENGTSRIREALNNTAIENIVNLQADEPCVNMSEIENVFQCLDEQHQIVSMFYETNKKDIYENHNNVKVVVDSSQKALYFSRLPIPYTNKMPYKIHVGIYGFKKNILDQMSNFKEDLVMKCENLEQLNWLYNSKSIKMLKTEYPSIGIDTHDDFEKFKEYLK